MTEPKPLATIQSDCCGEWCSFRSWSGSEPCWGRVEVVDEESWEDGDGGWDWTWIHACEGHVDTTFGWKYVPMPQ